MSQNTQSKEVNITLPTFTLNTGRFYPFVKEGTTKKGFIKNINLGLGIKAIKYNAFNSNLNLFDTSPFYGNGLSEHRTGNFLKTVDEESYFLSTKVGRYLTPEKNQNIDRGAWAGGLNI
mgnify:CR=1 FL=1